MPSETDSPPVPAYTRRQQTGSGTARSLLLTVFGEYVLPNGQAVWTAPLLRTMAGLAVEEKSARQALNRMAADGWIASERVGRRVRWSLTEPGRTLLTEGAERIYSFGRDRESWDGRWLVLLASVPESSRDLRQQLRNQLTWAGMGSPAPGVWVSPHASRESEVKQVVEGLGLGAEVCSFCGPFAGVGSERAMVEQAWHLAGLAAGYEAFIQQFAGLRPGAGDEALFAQIQLVHEWRKFPRLDPQLPVELLPPHWIGIRAVNVFKDQHQAWHSAAQEQWAALVEQG